MSSIGTSLPDYDEVGQLGEPPGYQNTESAAWHRTKHDRNLPLFEDDDLPPTYESLFGQIKEEWFTAENFADFLRKAGGILLASLACTLVLLFLLILPLAYVIIGVVYLDKCPINRMIPIYLIVAGILGLLQNGLMLMRKAVPANMTWNLAYRGYELFVAVISFIWFILGTIWVYSVFKNVCFNNGDVFCYCNSVCYWFAFVMITLTYILIVILLLIIAVVLIFSLRWFDRRAIEDRPPPAGDGYEQFEQQGGEGGYEQINSPPPQPDPGQGTEGLFLGANSFLNYRSTHNSGQDRPHMEND